MAIDLKQRQVVIETLRQLLAEAEAGDVDGFFAVIYRPDGMSVLIRHMLLTRNVMEIIGSLEQAKFDLMHSGIETEQESAT